MDLCDLCASVFDTYYPRRAHILRLLDPKTLERFYGSARIVKGSPQREPSTAARLPMAKEAPALEAAPPQVPQRKIPSGTWRADTIQVRCPLKHRANAPDEYWVPLRDRGGHARSHHKGNGERYAGPEVDFELQEYALDGKTKLEFTHFCYDHKLCAEAGGYGFLSEDAVRFHRNKTSDWATASTKTKDAAKTHREKQSA
ncbi:hypothetical protein SMALB_6202 [Streptomyces malaysiensis]|uniref:Uncharacterized protein n=1 Tax=Streptomyces malaysiensis TaxID=92644 RepID=A0A7X6AZT4_STRMQ|nr:hypothetical protein [Streptomyces malaysiensis]